MQLYDRHECCKKSIKGLNLDTRLYHAYLKHATLDICESPSIFRVVTDESSIKKRDAYSFLPVKFYTDTMLHE